MSNELDFSKKTSTTETGTLAKLWRKILVESGIMPGITFLVNRYLARTKTDSSMLKKKNRSTLLTDISATEMSWKSFVDLLFNFLNVKSVEFIVKIKWNSRETSHSISVLPPERFENPIDKLKEEQKNEKANSTKNSQEDTE